MNRTAVTLIDRLLGTVLCALLTVHRRIRDALTRKAVSRQPVRKILFIKLIEQGATVLAYGAVRRAIAKVGRENVFFCVFAENREILDVLDVVAPENVITIRHDGILRFFWDALRAVHACRRTRIDTTIDMEFFARASAILAYLTGAARRVGLHRFASEAPYRGDLMTERVQYNPYLHTAEGYALLVEALDAAASEIPLRKIPMARIETAMPEFHVSPQEQTRIRAKLEELSAGKIGSSIVLLNPNAGDLLPLRRWETQRFGELGRRIITEYDDVTIVLTGTLSERDETESVRKSIGSSRVVNFAGKTTVRELLVLYTIADVLVTNDSGPAHFASLTDIDNVVLFGPETPRLFGPRGGRPHVFWAELACSPCVNALNHRCSPCNNNVCMQAISVGEVFHKVRGCLEARRRLPVSGGA